MSDARKKAGEVPFEAAMERLDEIVSSMEGECMSLEDMVRNYEEGHGSCTRAAAASTPPSDEWK